MWFTSFCGFVGRVVVGTVIAVITLMILWFVGFHLALELTGVSGVLG